MNSKNYFFFNGEKYYTHSKVTLYELLKYFNYPIFNSTFIIEYNKLIYPESEWNKIIIKSNDKIEIITIVGGG